MAVAITDREKTIFEKGFGMENAERPNVPVTENSMFRIASITKLFTGFTIMGLVEEGKLSLTFTRRQLTPCACPGVSTCEPPAKPPTAFTTN